MEERQDATPEQPAAEPTRFSPGDRVRRRGQSMKQTVVRVSRRDGREMVALEGEPGWTDERELDFVTDHERAVEKEQANAAHAAEAEQEQAPGTAGNPLPGAGPVVSENAALRHDVNVLEDRLRSLRSITGAQDDIDLYRKVVVLQASYDQHAAQRQATKPGPDRPSAQADGNPDPAQPE